MEMGRITFDNSSPAVLPVRTVWLFEKGEVYECPYTQKIYATKDAALLNVPDDFTLVEYFISKNFYYENATHWIKITEMDVE